MKQILNNIAFFKKADAFVQVLALIPLFIFYFFKDWDVFALFIEAAVQILSCFFWSIYLSEVAVKVRAGVMIRRLFVAVLFLFCVSLLFDSVAFLSLMLMLVIGPPLGIAYFVITLVEANYYGKARKPFYLL